jgi:hypothetical protein
MLNKLIQLTGSATRSAVDLSKKVAVKSIPTIARASREFKKGYTSKDWKPSVIMPRSLTHPRGVYNTDTQQYECDMCSQPWDMENLCCSSHYKCWK